jgi:hypothetical protein
VRRFVTAFVAVFTLLLASHGRSRAEELDSILQQWAETRQRIKSLHLVLEGERMIAKGGRNSDMLPNLIIPASDEIYNESLTLTLDFEKNWARIDYVRPIGAQHHDSLVMEKSSLAFDGERFYDFTPRDANPFKQNVELPIYTCDLRILAPEFARMFFEPIHYPAFFSTGNIVRPDTGVSPVSLRIPDSIANYKLKGFGVIDGHEHVILVSPREIGQRRRYFEYSVDRSRNAAISRWLRISGDIVVQQYEVTGWQQIDANWYPSAWRIDFPNADGTVRESLLMKVTSLQFNKQFDRGHYQVSEVPGMIVIDDVTGKRYEVRAGGIEVPMKQVIAESEAGRGYGVLYALALVIALVGAFVAFRRVTRRQ